MPAHPLLQAYHELAAPGVSRRICDTIEHGRAGLPQQKRRTNARAAPNARTCWLPCNGAGKATEHIREGWYVEMRSKVTVVGAGNVGATLGQRVAERDYADVVLV